MNFLAVAGFDFTSSPEQVELKDYNKATLQAAEQAINLHVQS